MGFYLYNLGVITLCHAFAKQGEIRAIASGLVGWWTKNLLKVLSTSLIMGMELKHMEIEQLSYFSWGSSVKSHRQFGASATQFSDQTFTT